MKLSTFLIILSVFPTLGTAADSMTFTGADKITSISDIVFESATGAAIINGASNGGPSPDGQNLTITNITANGRTGNNYGGAITNNGILTILGNSSFANNSSTNGGAIFNNASEKTLAIDGAKFSNNTAGGGGGAIKSIAGTLQIKNSEFNNNTSSTNYGGAINVAKGDMDLSNSVFSGNSASYGGAIYTNGNFTFNITDTIFNKNHTTGSYYGGAIYTGDGTLNINGGEFNENYAAGSGGAISMTSGTITGAKFNGNYSANSSGGAINNTGALTVDNSSFENNRAKGIGGAINSSANLTIQNNSVFDGNTGTSGGAIYTSKVLTISGAKFTDNTATTGTGGAISGGNGALNISNAEFSNNRSNGGNGGGAIYAPGTDIALNNTRFTDNSAASYGGAIMALGFSGTMRISGGASFVGNSAAAGGAIFTNQVGINLYTDDGDIIFSGNTATSAGDGGADIYSNADTNIINITGNKNKVSMDGGIAGLGMINKTGANEFEILARADNTLFTGDFNQSAGTTTVYSNNFFTGNNNISNSSILHFANSATVNNLNFETGGVMDMRATHQFNTVAVKNFAGDGTAIINMNTDGSSSDLLRISDNVTGASILNFTVVGTNPTNEKIEVVDYDGATSDASFAMANGDILDIGAWQYGLFDKSGDGWYLEKTGETSAVAQTMNDIPALHLTIVRSGMNELRKRLGALRNNNGNNQLVGPWVRGYGKYAKIHDCTSIEMALMGMEGGFDIMTNALNGKVYFGLMGGMMSADDIKVTTKMNASGIGYARAPSAGAYLTWVHKSNSSSKWFVDLTARHFWVSSHVDIDNDLSKGYSVSRNFWAMSAEVGKLYYMRAPEFLNIGTLQDSHISIEPKAEIRYASGEEKSFLTHSNETATVLPTSALSSRIYLQLNFLPNGTESKWKPYVEFGLSKAYSGTTTIDYSDIKMCASHPNGFGSEYTIGTSATISDNTYAYGALTGEFGENNRAYMLNIGIRTKF